MKLIGKKEAQEIENRASTCLSGKYYYGTEDLLKIIKSIPNLLHALNALKAKLKKMEKGVWVDDPDDYQSGLANGYSSAVVELRDWLDNPEEVE